MDEHFKNTPFKNNIPVVLALLTIWYINFYNAESEAIITYTQYLQKLAGATEIIVDIDTGTIQYEYAGNPTDISGKLLSLGYPEVGSDKAGKILTKAQSYLSCAIGKLHS